MQNRSILNKFWRKSIKFNWIFGLIMIIVLGIPRFIIILKSNITGNYYYIFLIFLTMWFLPYIFLSKKGRQFIGITRVKKKMWILYSFLMGIGICAIVYFIGVLLYDGTIHNWFVYISKYQTAPGGINSSQRFTYFIIGGIMSMTFSPIGEELFYRGFVHGSFQVNVGDNKASYLDSLAFAVTHLAHFGIVYSCGTWEILIIPAFLWIFLMFITSRIFYICKKKTGSILGAIISHAGFNVTMMYFIFYHIL